MEVEHMYECEVIRYNSKVIGVYIYDDKEYFIASYEINLIDKKLRRKDKKWSRFLSPLELMVGALRFEYDSEAWLIEFRGDFMEYVDSIEEV